MRRLSFGTEQVDKDRFDILYAGICVSDRGINRTELNTFNHLVAKLEEIAKPIEGVKESAAVKFELDDDGGEVLLENTEYGLVNDLHSSIKWTKFSAKKAEETYTWFENIVDEVLTRTK